MGSVSLMRSLDRFIERHAAQLTADYLEGLPPSICARTPRVQLVNDGMRIAAYAPWPLEDGTTEGLDLPPIEPDVAAMIDAERFEDDCRMGW